LLLLGTVRPGIRSLHFGGIRFARTRIKASGLALLADGSSLILGQTAFGLSSGRLDFPIRDVDPVLGQFHNRLRLLGD
jgi:hypothetical protein